MKLHCTPFFIFLVCLAQAAFAQNWTGNVDSNWNNSANWSDWPLDGADIVIDPTFYTGAMMQPTVSDNAVFSPGEVFIQNGGILTIDANLSTEDDVMVVGNESAINITSGTFEVNFFDGGRLIFEMGSSMTLDGGAVDVGERFIVGPEALVTINSGSANSLERWIVDGGGQCVQNGGSVAVGQVFALGGGSIENDSGYELHGGTLDISGEMGFENELGVFEPTFFMTGGEVSVLGDIVWFGEGLGGGTPRFIMEGGTALINGNIVNSPLSTVSMYLHIGNDAAFNLSNGVIDQTTDNDSIVQSGNSIITLENVASVNVFGTYYATGGNTTVTAPTSLFGVGTVQFHDLFIGTGGTLTHQAPSMIHISGDFEKQGIFDPVANAVEFNGTSEQFLSGAESIPFYELVVSNSSDEGLTLNAPVNVAGHLQLNDGLLNSSAQNLVALMDGATSNMGGEETFVNGPMQKLGDDAFVFPVGKTDRWARLSITAPANASAAVIAEYFDEAYSSTSPVNNPLDAISNNEYWSLEATDLSEEIAVSLFWEDPTFSDIDCGNVTMARWNGTSWDQIPSNSTGDCSEDEGGNVVSQSALSDLGILTLGYFAPVGLGESAEILFSSFPNPTTGTFIIQLDHPVDQLGLTVNDLNGKRIINRSLNGNDRILLNLSDLPSGVYMLNLTSQGVTTSKKIVKR